MPRTSLVQPKPPLRYSPFLSCRQASRLITAKLDRELTSLERIALRLHLAICDACPIVIRQLDLMRRLLREWRDGIEE